MGYRIRRAKDPRRCLGLDASLFPHDDMDCPPESMWWELYYEDKLVGYAAAVRDKADPKTMVLNRAGVHPHHRGQGLQRRLIKIRETQARRLDCTLIVTYVERNNLASANNLIACGYRLYRPDYVWGLEDGLYFIKELK